MADEKKRPEMEGPQRPAEHARDASIPRGTDEHAGDTQNEAPGGLENPQAALGGADAVQKTSYGTGKGTDPDAREGDRNA